MGTAGEAMNIAHQQKKLVVDQLKTFRDRFAIPISDREIEDVPFIRPAEDSPEAKYLKDRMGELGSVPSRRRNVEKPFAVPALDTFKAVLDDSGDREISTTMAVVRVLQTLMRDKTIGPRIVPIVADESRTFGMEGMFRQYGIYSSVGQLYKPQDADQLMWYREDRTGQMLQEGITEAGAVASWIAAATAYSTHGVQTIPFFIFYSMFGFQRIGDFIWAAGDERSRGFLLGGTAGRTTLNGEGLQHEDGQSQVMASFVPNCISYDPTYAYEVAVIVRDGLRRMLEEQEDVFYYLTVMNENYHHGAMPEGAEEGIIRGMYRLRAGEDKKDAARVQLIGSGTILREVEAAAEILRGYNVVADVWSATSFNELRRDGIDCERWNLLHPAATQRVPYVTQLLAGTEGPVVASTDYIKLYADQLRPFIGRTYVALGTDGFGRSDTREKLREHFEVDRNWVALAALKALADEGKIERARVAAAVSELGLDPEKPNPVKV